MLYSNTNLNLYKSFIVVYETLNLTKASELLKISRQAISKNMKELSNQLGVILFLPTQRGVAPTPDAQKIYPEIKNSIESIIESERCIGLFNRNSNGIVRIAAHTSLAEFYITKFMKEFCEEYPNIKIEFTKQDDKADFIVTFDSVINKSNYKTINLYKDIGAFFASRDFLKTHGLGKSISKNKLLKLPIIERYEIMPYLNMQIDIDSNTKIIKSSSGESTVAMVKQNLGVGCISKEFLEIIDDSNLVVLDIENLTLGTTNSICAYNGTLSRPARAFVDGLVSFCNNKNFINI